MTTYTPDALPTTYEDGDIIDVDYTGASVELTLPSGKWMLEVWGAQGGGTATAGGGGGNPKYGGAGGYSVGTITLEDDSTTVFCYAGGVGTDDNRSNSGSTIDIAGGFNGGGLSNTAGAAGGGGGASDVRIGTDSLYARVIVAGGGGGAGWNAGGYAGGGEYGVCSGGKTTSGTGYYSGAGGPTAGGAIAPSGTSGRTAGTFGEGGKGKGNSSGGGGGGGGWYGGGGSGYSGGSGGGSGYVYTADTAASYPDGCLLTSDYYLTDAETIAGDTAFLSPTGASETGHTGNGYVRLTFVESAKLKATFVIDGTETVEKYDEGSTVAFPTDLPEHYVLTGWTVNGTAVDTSGYILTEDTTFTATGYYLYQPGDTITLSADRTLYAMWTKISVSLSPNPVTTGGSVLISVELEG